MKSTVQARFDPRALAALERVVERLGWRPARMVREGIRLLAAYYRELPRSVVGMGRFASGLPDLGCNKERMRGLGR